MKQLFTFAALSCTMVAVAQPRVVRTAIVKMQTEITFPENFGGPGGGGPPGGGDGGNTVIMGGPGGMESSSTLYYTPDHSKLESTSDFGNNIVISDRKEKKTTTLIEAMGKKTGFYSTEEDEAVMRNRMDSIRNARRDSLQKLGIPIAAPAAPEIVYSDETKKIAGYTCKKAVIKTRDRQGAVNESTVWYCPEFKMGEGFSFTGGRGGFMGGPMMGGLNGLDKIEGFPMEYSMSRNNGMKMHMTVTKVQLDAAIDDKTFEVPKGYELKSMKDMQGRDGRMMIRIGGPGGPGGPNN
jgi:hypothetical protein